MSTFTLTDQLKQKLWAWYGTEEHEAEWDGHVYGGGKISQRFWEYFVSVEMLDLAPGSVVLEVGGGSPATGLSLFPRLLASAGVEVIVLDNQFGDLAPGAVENVTMEQGLADYDVLREMFRKHNPTHLACVSVLEHASHEQQRGIFDAVEAGFSGETAVFTFEFHEYKSHWEQQLTTESLSNAVSGLHRYYLDRLERAPLNCVNAFEGLERLWYPMATRFRRKFSAGLDTRPSD